MLVVNQNLPVASLRDLIGLAKAKPGTISFASPGAGSQAHLAGELLARRTGAQLVHVPDQGIAPAVTDLLGGHVSMMFSQVISAIEPIRTGKLKALGVASPKRNALLPQTPTIAEQDLPGFEAVSWYALMVPAATPPAIVDRLQAEVSKILRSRTARPRRWRRPSRAKRPAGPRSSGNRTFRCSRPGCGPNRKPDQGRPQDWISTTSTTPT